MWTPSAEGCACKLECDWVTLTARPSHFGLALVSGINSETGLAGLTLGGGIGWLMRKYGLTIDYLISVEVVTVDGEVLEVSARRNPDLFWAIRGVVAISGSSPASSSIWCRWDRRSTAGSCSIQPRTPARFYGTTVSAPRLRRMRSRQR